MAVYCIVTIAFVLLLLYKAMCFRVVTAIRETCADWINNKEDPNDPAIKGEKDPKTGHKVRIKNRACGLSSTQLYMVGSLR